MLGEKKREAAVVDAGPELPPLPSAQAAIADLRSVAADDALFALFRLPPAEETGAQRDLLQQVQVQLAAAAPK